MKIEPSAKKLEWKTELAPGVPQALKGDTGRITQILTNVISPDGQTLGIIYMTMDEAGKTPRVLPARTVVTWPGRLNAGRLPRPE